jgi:hypothetical protein
MDHIDDLFLSYNLERLLDIYDKMKSLSVYSGILDITTKSSDFVNIIVDNLIYYDLPSIEDVNEIENDFIFEN